MKPGNLEGRFWGRYKGILGAAPLLLLIRPPRILPQDSQVSLSTPVLFHTLDLHTERYASNRTIIDKIVGFLLFDGSC